jgi:23S rRNA (guanosine2251-2'-O)-methyltransferase
MREIYVIAHDLRSTHNVGSLFRTAEGLGAKEIYLTGYTPYPSQDSDARLPHVSAKLTNQIEKTALGATKHIVWQHFDSIDVILNELKQKGIEIVALEQSPRAISLHTFKAPNKLALVLGTEVTGLPKDVLDKIKLHVCIPMQGKKESFNVVQAAAMALYELQFH